jgi:hypothetical protein
MFAHRNDAPDAASRIAHIAPVPRNQVKVGMKQGLPRCFAHVDAEIKSVGLE